MIISHDLAGTGFSCHRVIVMCDGAIVEEGDVEDILAAPSTATANELIAAGPGAAPRRGERRPRAAASTREERSPCG